MKKKKINVYDIASELCNELLEIYFDGYNGLSDVKRKKINLKYNPVNLMLDTYDYKKWYKEESDDSTKKNDEEEL